MQNLNDKVAWITGAGTGIGEAAAIALAEAGMKVVISGRRRDKLEEVATRCNGRASIEPLDIADKGSVHRVVERILDQHGRVDVLVASAGINVTERYWHNVSDEDWDSVIATNLNGAFYCCRAVLPAMKAQRSGLIINISSWAGKYVSAMTGPAYTAAKHAMNAMNESLNMEACVYGVRSTSISPGEVATPILDTRPFETPQEERERMVQPEDCGALIRFIAELPEHVCINDLTISPTWNRSYVPAAQALSKLK